MIFSENKLYGWGSIDIAMPRAVFEPHPGRLRKAGEVTDHSRQGAAAYRWHSSRISRIFLDDYPWTQALVLCIFSSLIIVYICLLHSTLPKDKKKQLAKPIEILVAVQKDEPRTAAVSVQQEPLASLKPEHIKKSVPFESVTEEPQKKVIDRSKEMKQDVIKEIAKIAPEPRSPLVKIKQEDARKKTKEPQSIASVMPIMEGQTKPEKITISAPIIQKRKYTEKNQNTISQPRQASKVASFVSPENVRPTEDIVDIGSHQGRKNYIIQNKQKISDPQLKTTANLVALNQSDEIAEPASLKTESASRRYGTKANTLLPAAQTVPPSTSQQLLFPPQRREKIPGLEPNKLYSQFKQQPPSLPSVSQKTERVSRSKKQEFSFQSKKWEENPTLTPLASNKSLTNANRSAGKSASPLTKVHNFSEEKTPGEIEPSELINLKEFNVCIDPEKEFRQKTQLAAHLDRPSRIEAEGVVFFIKYTESGYTIEIGIYNPQGRIFKDRCEVLELAINSIVNRLN